MSESQRHHGMSRRDFICKSAAASALAMSPVLAAPVFAAAAPAQLRLGGPVLPAVADPGDWARAARQLGYSAASFPLSAFFGTSIDDALIKAYADAAAKADVVIAELSTFSQTFPDDQARAKSIDQWCACLEVADRIGARCAVTVGGERIPRTSPGGPSPTNLTAETFEMVVENTRKVIDTVKPTRTYFTYETMGWLLPNSPDVVVSLIKAVDRDRFAAHLDITNLINGSDRYFNNAALTRECFQQFGARIRSCHLKDVLLTADRLVRITEVGLGLGRFDHRTFLKEISNFPDIPIMLEHLTTADDYARAAQHLRTVAEEAGVGIR